MMTTPAHFEARTRQAGAPPTTYFEKGEFVKVTIQYYDKEPAVRNAITKLMADKGHTLETKDDFFQTVALPDEGSAKALMTELHAVRIPGPDGPTPLPNVQFQTAA